MISILWTFFFFTFKYYLLFYMYERMLIKENKRFYIYDFDTELPFPCGAKQYIIEAFHPELQLNEQFQRYILF